jgi:predicted transcriptional regulator
MPEKWTGKVVGKMHVESITQFELASELGVTKNYVSMILHGKRNPPDAKERFNNALDRVIEKKKG